MDEYLYNGHSTYRSRHVEKLSRNPGDGLAIIAKGGEEIMIGGAESLASGHSPNVVLETLT